jgi:hypothetical protein
MIYEHDTWSLTEKEEERWIMYAPKKDEIKDEWGEFKI